MSMSAATAVMEKQKANYERFDTYDTRRPAKRRWSEELEEFLRTRGERRRRWMPGHCAVLC